MQRCLPFKWQRYWNCGTKEFDLRMILYDMDDLKISVQDRLLLTLLARIWTGKEGSLTEVKEAVHVLDEEQREIDMYRKHSKWYGSAYFIMQKV